MPFAQINDAKLYYELHGQGEPLILIAGYSCDHLFWELMLEGLKPYFQVLLFDNRGSGQSSEFGSLSLETMAADTMALADHLGLVKPNILGQSMGGAIAQLIAREEPKKINNLILLNSFTRLDQRALSAISSLLNLRKQGVSLDLLIDASLPWFFSCDFLADQQNVLQTKEAMKNNPYLQSVDHQELQYNALLSFDSRKWLHNISVPTLVIAAQEDLIAPVSESLQLSSIISGAALQLVAGGHSSTIEQATEVNRLILNFLKLKGHDRQAQ